MLKITDWKQKLFKELIESAKFQVSNIGHQRAELLRKNVIGEFLGCQIALVRSSDPNPGEADSVRADIVEALALAGDLRAAEKITRSISVEGYGEAESARISIIKGWARKNLRKALKLASTIADNDIDEDEKKEKYKNAIFAILETIAEGPMHDEVRALADWIVRQSNQNYERNAACVMLVRATAAMGEIDEARKMAERERIPYNQIPEYLAVYEFSHAVEDLKAARAIAEKYDFEPYEQWLKIAEATCEPQDIARARTEVMAIPVKDMAEGWTADFNRNFNLLKLAKISGDQNDITIARRRILANPQSANSLFMGLCRITRDRNDFALLLNRAKWGGDRYSALACVAEIIGQEADFIAALKAALDINAPPRGVSVEYLRGRSLAELAQVLCGKPIAR